MVFGDGIDRLFSGSLSINFRQWRVKGKRLFAKGGNDSPSIELTSLGHSFFIPPAIPGITYGDVSVKESYSGEAIMLTGVIIGLVTSLSVGYLACSLVVCGKRAGRIMEQKLAELKYIN